MQFSLTCQALALLASLALLPRWSSCNPVDPGLLVPREPVGTAECGPTSPSGSQKCGMGECCSRVGFCGTTSDYCGSGCQTSYGQCKVAKTPSCNPQGGSSNGRTIGYWQSRNTQRACDTVTPKQINVTGLTHLYYAFANFDNTFTIYEADPSSTYSDFTALKSSSLQTWIAIGGQLTSGDPAPWSAMTSSSSNRKTFIASLTSFMNKYGFQGVDIDWEFPGYSDTQNLVSLVKEMRASFGSKFGISATLPADPTSVMGFDAKGMEPYMDWFNFMAYDMNYNSSRIHAQTDITDMTLNNYPLWNYTQNANPLWADGLNMTKVNFGMAYYGRGFTPKTAGCLEEKCSATWAIKDGPCTKDGGEGVLSLTEIKRIAQTSNPQLKPMLNTTGMYQVITWDNQWMGYDNEKSFALKRYWANGKCFGGTFIWSLDFYNHGKVY